MGKLLKSSDNFNYRGFSFFFNIKHYCCSKKILFDREFHYLGISIKPITVAVSFGFEKLNETDSSKIVRVMQCTNDGSHTDHTVLIQKKQNYAIKEEESQEEFGSATGLLQNQRCSG